MRERIEVRGFDVHQIARVIVAMHIYAWLCEIVAQDAPEAFFQPGALLVVKRDAEMPGDIPLRK